MSSNPRIYIDYGVEAIKWLFGCRSKSVGAGLDCAVHSTTLTKKSAAAAAVCGLWRYICVICQPMPS